MSLLQNRIQGMGSNGSKKKVWKCPTGHLLQPNKASPGSCDGCRKRIAKNDDVMECKTCNWYLCQHCHPQESQERSWFWGSVATLADKVSQEFKDLQEVAEDAETRGPLAACAAPPVNRHDELYVGLEETSAPETPTSAAPQTPANAAPPASNAADTRDQATPPKTEAPKEQVTIDLLALDVDAPKPKAPQALDPFNAMDVLGNKDPYDVLGGL